MLFRSRVVLREVLSDLTDELGADFSCVGIFNHKHVILLANWKILDQWQISRVYWLTNNILFAEVNMLALLHLKTGLRRRVIRKNKGHLELLIEQHKLIRVLNSLAFFFETHRRQDFKMHFVHPLVTQFKLE